jgi:hypothetical protein
MYEIKLLVLNVVAVLYNAGSRVKLDIVIGREFINVVPFAPALDTNTLYILRKDLILVLVSKNSVI